MAACSEKVGPPPGTDIANNPRGQHDQRKRHGEEEQRKEGECRQGHHDAVPQGPAADAEHGLNDNGQHGGLYAVEQAGENVGLLKQRIGRRQRQDDEEAGDDEQRASDDATLGAVQQPADIGRQLLGFRAGKQGAVVEGVEEPGFRNPALLLHQHLVHQRDLAGSPSFAAQRMDLNVS